MWCNHDINITGEGSLTSITTATYLHIRVSDGVKCFFQYIEIPNDGEELFFWHKIVFHVEFSIGDYQHFFNEGEDLNWLWDSSARRIGERPSTKGWINYLLQTSSKWSWDCVVKFNNPNVNHLRQVSAHRKKFAFVLKLSARTQNVRKLSQRQ